ncbi:MAG: hypothetical protein IIB67_01125 [Proteobacteria bacterium]|nr:hypothetical protein [Pseudomonadota bacterium]
MVGVDIGPQSLEVVGAVAETFEPDPVDCAADDDAYDSCHRLFNSLGPMFA